MAKQEKKAFEKRVKQMAKKTSEKRHESDEEYLKRIMGEKAKKSLKSVDPVLLRNNDQIITHEDQERY